MAVGSRKLSLFRTVPVPCFVVASGGQVKREGCKQLRPGGKLLRVNATNEAAMLGSRRRMQRALLQEDTCREHRSVRLVRSQPMLQGAQHQL